MRLAIRVVRACWYTLAVLIIAFALLITLLRLVTPWLNTKKSTFEHFFSTIVHKPTHIGHLRATISGFVPVLALDSVTVQNLNPEENLCINHLIIRFDLWRSIKAREVKMRGFKIDGVRLTVLQDKGFWKIKEINADFSQGGMSEGLGNVLDLDYLQLKNIQIIYKNANQSIPLFIHKAALYNESSKIKGYIQGALVEKNQKALVIVSGHLEKQHIIFDRLFFDIQNVAFNDALSRRILPEGLFMAGRISGKAWLSFHQKTMQTFQSKLSFSPLSIQTNVFSLHKTHLSGEFGWQRQSDKKNEIIVKWVDRSNMPGLRFVWGDHERILQVESLGLSFAKKAYHVYQIFKHNPHKELPMTLQGMIPYATVRWIDDFDFRRANYHGFLKDVSLVNHPLDVSLNHLTGILSGSFSEGEAVFQLNNSRMNFPHFFISPTHVDYAGVTLHWFTEDSHIKFFIRNGTLRSSFFNANAEGMLDVPQQNMNDAQLSIEGHFNAFGGKELLHWIPLKSFSPNLKKWLLTSLSQEGAVDGDVLFRGPLNGYPYVHQEGMLDIIGHLHGIALEFNPLWPRLMNINGNLHVTESMVKGDIDNAYTDGNKLENISFKIVRKDADNLTHLRIMSSLDSTQAKVIKYFNQTPFQQKVAYALRNVDVKDPFHLNIHIDIPLGDTANAVQYDGDLLFKNNTVQTTFWKYPIQNLRGILGFNNNGVDADRIDGDLNHAPIRLAFKSDEKATYFEGDYLFNADDLRDAYPSVPLLKGITGVSPLSFKGTVPHDHSPTEITFMSDLNGVGVSLPPPFSKKAEKRLQTTLTLAANEDVLKNVDLYWGTKDRVKITMNSDKSQCLHLHFNVFEFSPWVDLIQHNRGATQKQALAFNRSKIEAEHFEFNGKDYGKVNTDIQKIQNHFHLNLNANPIHASLDIDTNHKRIEGYISQLILDELIGESDDKSLDLSSIPNVKLSIDNVQYKTSELNDIHVTLTHQKDGVDIQSFEINDPLIHAELSGSLRTHHGFSQTDLHGEASSQYFPILLRNLGLHNVFEMKSGETKFHLKWNDVLNHFNINKATGSVSLSMHDGAIVVEGDSAAAVSLGKVINLLSLQSLIKRFQFDFSDLQTHGLTFEDLKGNFTLSDGVITTENGLIQGPVATIQFYGIIDSVEKAYDLQLIITPHITSSLPVIATIAGGPVAGMVTFMANRVFGSDVDKMVERHYRLLGTWDHPILRKVHH